MGKEVLNTMNEVIANQRPILLKKPAPNPSGPGVLLGSIANNAVLISAAVGGAVSMSLSWAVISVGSPRWGKVRTDGWPVWNLLVNSVRNFCLMTFASSIQPPTSSFNRVISCRFRRWLAYLWKYVEFLSPLTSQSFLANRPQNF